MATRSLDGVLPPPPIVALMQMDLVAVEEGRQGPLTAVGHVVKPGRRVAFAEGEVLGAAGRAVATASSSLLVFPLAAT